MIFTLLPIVVLTRYIRLFQFVLLIVIIPLSNAVAREGDGVIEPGEASAEELARATQNPVANLISVPFQNNTNFNFGPREKTQNVMNIQPVLPFSISDDWNLITRTILPVISQPAFTQSQNRKNGFGDATFTAFFSPKDSGGLIWGVGPVALIPTSTDDRLGAGEWGGGPSAVALTMQGPWVVGSLVSNVWSFSGGDDEVNFFTWQPFINYNLDDGWYISSSPIVTANWEADNDNTWTVPLGGGFGRVFRVGQQNMNAQFQTFYNVEKPDDLGPDWTIRFQLQFLFPK